MIQNNEYTINIASITYIQGILLISILEKFQFKNIGVRLEKIYHKKCDKKLLNIEHEIKYKRKDLKLFNLIENTYVMINNVKYGKTNKFEGL